MDVVGVRIARDPSLGSWVEIVHPNMNDYVLIAQTLVGVDLVDVKRWYTFAWHLRPKGRFLTFCRFVTFQEDILGVAVTKQYCRVLIVGASNRPECDAVSHIVLRPISTWIYPVGPVVLRGLGHCVDASRISGVRCFLATDEVSKDNVC